MDLYLSVKALHIIFVVVWFSGLFYTPRLFIYLIEAQSKPALEREILTRQLKLMLERLWYIIVWPGAILTLIFALFLLYLNPALLTQAWMHLKLFFVCCLFLYHYKTHRFFIAFKYDRFNVTSSFMRQWNEIATLLLVAIVLLAVLKNYMAWLNLFFILIGLGLLLYLFIRLYKRLR